MNFKKWTTALMLALAVSSCIQDEALNSEAAIDACTGADVQLAHINSAVSYTHLTLPTIA